MCQTMKARSSQCSAPRTSTRACATMASPISPKSSRSPTPTAARVNVQQPGKPRLRLMSSISRLCEVQSQTSIYELVAGRSAMCGVIVAIFCESLTSQSFLGQLSANDLGTGAALMGGAALAAAVMGTRSVNDERTPIFLESVISSLTAVKRSKSSISVAAVNSNVDKYVDEVVQMTFTAERLREFTDYENFDFDTDNDADV